MNNEYTLNSNTSSTVQKHECEGKRETCPSKINVKYSLNSNTSTAVQNQQMEKKQIFTISLLIQGITYTNSDSIYKPEPAKKQFWKVF